MSHHSNIKHCGYCREIGHTIINCKCSAAKKLNNEIEEASAFTYLFPSIGKYLIESKLKNLVCIELKLLMNKWRLNSVEKKIKTRAKLIEFLLKNYCCEHTKENDMYFSKNINMWKRSCYSNLYILEKLMQTIRNISPIPPNIEEILYEIKDFHTKMKNILEEERLQREEEERNYINHLRRKNNRFEIRPVNLITKKTKCKETFDCGICLNNKIHNNEKIEIKDCRHSFCGSCTIDYLDNLQIRENFQEIICPLCRGKVKTFNITNPDLCDTIAKKFCKYEKKTIKIYYREDSWYDYLLSWVPISNLR